MREDNSVVTNRNISIHITRIFRLVAALFLTHILLVNQAIAKKPIATSTASKSIYILSVGIDNYPPPLNLASCEADAISFTSKISQNGKYRPIDSKVLINENATREGILKGLEWIVSKIGANDVGVIYIAGQGEFIGSEYALIPSGRDALPGKGVVHNDAEYQEWKGAYARSRWITASDITKSINSIKGALVVIADTNYSGLLLKNSRESTKSANSNKIIFSATSGKELAQEDTSIGGGVFTRILLKYLNDNNMSIESIDRDSAQKISRLVFEQTGRSQRPLMLSDGKLVALEGVVAENELGSLESSVKLIKGNSCISAQVPNPSPVPNESTEFIGHCKSEIGREGIVVWKQNGAPSSLSVLVDDGTKYAHSKTIIQSITGNYNGLFFGDNVRSAKKAIAYLDKHPGYCNSGDAIGICDKNGEQIGFKVIPITPRTEKHPGVYALYNGQMRNWKMNGIGKFVSFDMNAIVPTSLDEKEGYFIDNDFFVSCSNIDDCNKRVKAEHLFKEAKENFNQLKCDTALSTDLNAQRIIGGSVLSDGSRISFRSCLSNKKFSDILSKKDPQAMFLAAGLYESEGERGRAKTIYKRIIESFHSNPIAIKAADRLTRLTDVEAIEYQAQRSRDEVKQSDINANQRAYNACKIEINSCYSRTNGKGNCYRDCDRLR